MRDVVRLWLPEGTKLCTMCHTGKPFSEFYKQPNGRDGLNATCKSCHAQKYGRASGYCSPREQQRKEVSRLRRESLSKVCSQCKETKKLSDFHRAARGRLTAKCLACTDENRKLWPNKIGHKREERSEILACLSCHEPFPRADLINGFCKPCYRIHQRQEREWEATERGRRLRTYQPREERERRAAMKQAEDKADRLRSKWARAWLKPFKEASDREYLQSEEYHRECREKYRKRYQDNPDRERQRVQFYKHSNPHAVARWDDIRKQRAAEQSDGTLTHEAVGKLFGDARKCPYCDQPLNSRNKALDHMVPLSKGGMHGLRNVLICCRRCNTRKHDKDFGVWLSMLDDQVQQRMTEVYRKRFGVVPEQPPLLLVFREDESIHRMPTGRKALSR